MRWLLWERLIYCGQRPGASFIVHTAQGAIKEYGTEFNVNTQGEHTSVVLVNGSISVIPKSGKERMMTPGLLAEMGSSGVSMSKVDVAPYIAWNTGQYSFEDSSLEEIMQVVGNGMAGMSPSLLLLCARYALRVLSAGMRVLKVHWR